MRLVKTQRSLSRALGTLLFASSLAACGNSNTPDGSTPSGGSSTGTAGSGVTAGTGAGTSGGSTSGGAGGSSSIGSGGAGASSVGGIGSVTGGAATGGTATGGTATGGTATGGQGGGTPGSCVAVTEFNDWPAGKGPTDIAKAAVNNFKSHTKDAYTGAGYAWTFAYVGSLQFTKMSGDTATNTKLISDFDGYNSDSVSNASNATVDDRAFGDLPLEIFIENANENTKKIGLARADAQWEGAGADGITKDARYWADDMFMITGLQVYAYRATKDVKYLTRAGVTMKAYLAALQQADGHFWHTKQSHAYWGRANGWIAAGMTELLLDLPAGADRDAILAGYKKQMDGLVAVQVKDGADAGTWRQVLDVPTANPESSCTAMFTFALVTGIRNGWLADPKYVAAARAGWLALGNKTDANGVLDKVCPGTGQANQGDLASQQKFYTDIKLGTNDQHGQAPLLWAARALLRSDCSGVR
jgi:unsaturated rhamnogalacturonyl hydrolase